LKYFPDFPKSKVPSRFLIQLCLILFREYLLNIVNTASWGSVVKAVLDIRKQKEKKET